MIKYGPAVDQRGFTASNLFALSVVTKTVEDQVGTTTPYILQDIGPLLGLMVDLRQTTRAQSIYSGVAEILRPMGYVVTLEGAMLFVAPVDTRELKFGRG